MVPHMSTQRIALTTWFFLLLAGTSLAAIQDNPAGAKPEVWTLREAVHFAVENNPDARMAVSRIEGARAAIAMEKSAFYPQLSFESSYSQTNNPMYSFGNILNQGAFTPNIDFNEPGRTDDLNASIRLGYRLYNGGRDVAGLKAAKSQKVASRWEFDAVRAQLALEVVRTFNHIVQAEEIVKTQQGALKAISASLAVAQARYEEGVLLKADLLDLEVQQSKSREDLIQAKHNLDVAQKVFRNLLGLKGETVAVDEESSHAQEIPPTSDYEQRAELKSANAMIRAAEARVRQARGGYYPSIDSYVGYSVDKGWETDGSGNSWQAGIRLNYNLFDGRRTSAEVARATAKLSEAREQKRKIELAIGLEVERAQLALKDAEARLQVAEQGVKQAEESARINRARFQEGVVLASDLIAVENRLTDARVRRTVAQTSHRIAIAALRRAIGLPQFSDPSTQSSKYSSSQ
jgi:outer membrane protein TolC